MYILSHSNSGLNLFLDSLLMTKLRANDRHYRNSLEKEEKNPQIIIYSCSADLTRSPYTAALQISPDHRIQQLGRSHLFNLQCKMNGVHKGYVNLEATNLLGTVTPEA